MIVLLRILQLAVFLFLGYSIYNLVNTMAETSGLPKTIVFLSAVTVTIGSAILVYDSYLIINFILALF